MLDSMGAALQARKTQRALDKKLTKVMKKKGDDQKAAPKAKKQKTKKRAHKKTKTKKLRNNETKKPKPRNQEAKHQQTKRPMNFVKYGNPQHPATLRRLHIR